MITVHIDPIYNWVRVRLSYHSCSSISSPDCDTLEQRIAELTREKTRLEAQQRSCPSSSSTSCRGKCGARFNRTLPCQCNNVCQRYSNCCADYATLCSSSSAPSQRAPLVWTSGRTTDNDLARLSEELLDRDADNAASKVTFDSIFWIIRLLYVHWTLSRLN